LIQQINEKLELEYPTEWQYRVIGSEEDLLRKAIDEVLLEMEYQLKFSNKSSSGKYISLEISTTVESEEIRNSIFQNLKSHTHIKMVL
jgi:putative lipoic acid-binding regulatory protein